MRALLVCMIVALGCARVDENVGSSGLSEVAARGKSIFHQGIGASGDPIEATFTFGGTLRGSAAACVVCHGSDGRGRREGGFQTADLSPHLLKAQPNGRKAWDKDGLAKAITEGVDPAGRPLDPGMPRYRLSEDRAKEIVSYLWERDRDRDPGVRDGHLSIGILLPPSLEEAAGEGIRAVVKAVFAEANRQGGVYRRELELLTVREGDVGDVLALVASHGDPWPEGIPVVGPLGFAREEPDALAPVFHLLPSFEEQGRLAAIHGASLGPVSLQVGRGPEEAAWARGVAHEIERRKLAMAGDEGVVLFAGARAEVPGEKRRGLVVPASLAGLPGSTAILPVRPFQGEFLLFLEAHGIRATHLILQAQAFAAAKVLVEGLRRSGSAPTRASLIAGLETFRAFDTAVVPPLSFGPNRRMGAGGSWIIDFGEEGQPLSAIWASLPPK